MKSENKVHTLIKCLSMSEKRYFKLYSSGKNLGSQNKHLAIFDAILFLQDEDDLVLIDYLKKKKINTDFLAADKNYLYNLILKSLQSFYAGKSLNIILNENLISIEVLFYKGLLGQCLKLIEKSIPLAIGIDNFQKTIELLNWKRSCIGMSQGLAAVTYINKEIRLYHSIEANLQVYNDLYFDISNSRIQFNKARTKEAIDHVKSIMESKELKNPKMALSLLAKLRFHQIYAQYFFINNNKPNEYNHNEEQLDLINNNPLFKKEFPLYYIAISSRFLSLTRELKPKLFLALLNEYKEFGEDKNNSPLIRDRVFAYGLMSEFTYYIDTHNFKTGVKKAKDYLPLIEKKYASTEDSSKMTIYYLFAFVNFAMGEKKESLRLVNHILNEYKNLQRPDLYTWTLILNLTIHFEFKDFEYLKNIIKSTAIRIEKNKRLFIVESTILEFFKSTVKNNKQSAIDLEVKLLIEKLESLKSNSLESNAFSIFDFTLWAKSYLAKQSLNDFLS